MVNKFIVLSAAQTEWVRRAVAKMLKLITYYASRGQPMTDDEYERVNNMFADCIKKSRNNELVIRCAVAFMTYLAELEKKGFSQDLDEQQVGMLETFTDSLFDMAAEIPGGKVEEGWEEECSKELETCCERFAEHKLVRELAEIFKSYFFFCCTEIELKGGIDKNFGYLSVGHKDAVLDSMNSGKKTIVINIYAGTGAGKKEAGLILTADLKEAGYTAEYVEGCARKMAEEQKLELLDGTEEHQLELLKTQIQCLDAKIGQVDFIITDAPILRNQIYNKELTLEYQTMLKELNSHYYNYNFFLQRDIPNLEKMKMPELEQRGKGIYEDIDIKAIFAVNQITYQACTLEEVEELLHDLVTMPKLINYIDGRQETDNKELISKRAVGVR